MFLQSCDDGLSAEDRKKNMREKRKLWRDQKLAEIQRCKDLVAGSQFEQYEILEHEDLGTLCECDILPDRRNEQMDLVPLGSASYGIEHISDRVAIDYSILISNGDDGQNETKFVNFVYLLKEF